MERHVDKGGEPTSERLTEEMLEEANKIVDGHINSKYEVKDRYCRIYGAYSPDFFTICVTEDHAYKDFKFKIKDDGFFYIGMEGNFRD